MIGSACKYFHWSDPEKIKWEMPWKELMLYLSSIPSYNSVGKEKMETKDASEIF